MASDDARPDRVRPLSGLKGVDAQGNFKTAAAKEYPSELNLAFALALCRAPRQPQVPAVEEAEFAQELAAVCRMYSGMMMPDYQPHARSNATG